MEEEKPTSYWKAQQTWDFFTLTSRCITELLSVAEYDCIILDRVHGDVSVEFIPANIVDTQKSESLLMVRVSVELAGLTNQEATAKWLRKGFGLWFWANLRIG